MWFTILCGAPVVAVSDGGSQVVVSRSGGGGTRGESKSGINREEYGGI